MNGQNGMIGMNGADGGNGMNELNGMCGGRLSRNLRHMGRGAWLPFAKRFVRRRDLDGTCDVWVMSADT